MYNFFGFTFKSIIILTATLSPSRIIPQRICSVPIYSLLNLRASIKEFSIILLLLGVSPILSAFTIGAFSLTPISSSISFKTASAVTPWFARTLLATPVPSSTKPYKMCSDPI